MRPPFITIIIILNYTLGLTNIGFSNNYINSEATNHFILFFITFAIEIKMAEFEMAKDSIYLTCLLVIGTYICQR